VLAHVRAHDGPSQRAAALATTADDSPATAATLRASGFADVLPKPLRVEALREAVARHLPAPAERIMPGGDALDDEQARRAAGGDMAIVVALRALFVGELEALPAEIEAMALRGDREALRERLHRLDASAGFCGVPALIAAAARLRSLLDGPTWPTKGVADFLAAGERARGRLSG
jgi:HPt (histidine-containing phosphotransfer) domain-containing protein